MSLLSLSFTVPDFNDSCMCAQSDNTAAVISGVVVAVAFMITTAIIVIAVLVLRYRRGNNFTGRKEKYNDFMCDCFCLYIFIHAEVIYVVVNRVVK